jgi:hypothetical protein
LIDNIQAYNIWKRIVFGVDQEDFIIHQLKAERADGYWQRNYREPNLQ